MNKLITGKLGAVEALLDRHDCHVVIAADGETRTVENRDGQPVEVVPAGGVAIAMDRVSQAIGATYVGRSRNQHEMQLLDGDDKTTIAGRIGTYELKRVEVSPGQMDSYYYGYSNQSLWPLFHTAFERPVFRPDWFEGYVDVNKKFATAIRAEIDGPTLVWVNDYQLALVPALLGTDDDVTLAYFWHIPWPGWDRFRMLPQREEILASLLSCDFIGFHTEDYARNFLAAAERGLGAHVNNRALTATLDGHTVRCASLPIGVDPQAIRTALGCDVPPSSSKIESASAPRPSRDTAALERLFDRNAVILGADRLDYSKGLRERLIALDTFFRKYPEYRGRVAYLGIMSPTREKVPAYRRTKEEIVDLTRAINDRYATPNWHPLHMRYRGLPREEIARLYARADVCLVTSLADGMNLVAKEFVVAASCSSNPGMLVLSEFAGAHADLPEALSINPLDPDDVADAIAAALEMPPAAKKEAIGTMTARLEREDVYTWAQEFVRGALDHGTRGELAG